jgi:hypothetical protein
MTQRKSIAKEFAEISKQDKWFVFKVLASIVAHTIASIVLSFISAIVSSLSIYNSPLLVISLVVILMFSGASMSLLFGSISNYGIVIKYINPAISVLIIVLINRSGMSQDAKTCSSLINVYVAILHLYVGIRFLR